MAAMKCSAAALSSADWNSSMRFAIATLGCKVNQYDSAIIEARLGSLGMERGEFDEHADVYIVNTCTVTDRADVESLRLARRARKLNPDARIIMTGCFAQASPESLARAHEVDAVIGLGRIGDLERAALAGVTERVMVSNLRKETAAIELGAVALDGHTRAFLKLQEGCDQFCSFCIVPLSRGRSRSVEPRRVIAAIEGLHARGFKEVVLSGVHLGGYGRDLDPPITLEALLDMIAERAPIGRVRISSLDPEELSDRAISIIAESERFCPHFHLPLQAGEDWILARMRRRYTTAYFRERVDRILEQMGDAAIGSDLIAGFPGESAQHFEDYLKFVESLPLAYFHVFPYSVRAGTTAAKFGGRVTASEIKRRAAILRELGEDKRRAFARRFVGAKLDVLLEEVTAAGRLRGYSRNYIRVLTDGDAELTNHEVEVEGWFAEGVQLVAQIIRTDKPPRGGAAVHHTA
jgi:threonylcarbamoyladenosine tRNA methylthiotransferase MtaB